MTIILVLAMSENGVIGDKGALPWRIPDDLRRFKSLTMGKPMVMGRRTWDSFPKKPLPGRTNIVVTRDTAWRAQGAVRAGSPDEALGIAAQEGTDIMVIGGAQIYRALLTRAGRVELTLVQAQIPGDTKMPVFDPAQWRETLREPHVTEQGLAYSYITLERR